MKTILFLLLCAGFSLDSRYNTPQEPRKWALLIGVGNYADPVKFQKLDVTNGIPLMRKTLMDRGFPAENITTLVDGQATRQAILKALGEHLVEQVAAGDIVVFHFTGHGMSVPDDNGDEIDGQDEAIVPYDGDIIRDDLLGKLLTQLRIKVGATGQVLVLLDACHSGTGTRDETGRSKPAAKGLFFKKTIKTEILIAPMPAFFASQSFEWSYQLKGRDGLKYGPLTYAFCLALEQSDSTTSYRGLFDRIAWIISLQNGQKHTPQAEGNLDLLIFGGRVPPPPPYFKSKIVMGPQTAIIDAGLLKGLHPGTEMVLYPVDTRDTVGVQPIATGRLEETQTGLLESVLKFRQLVPEAQIEQGWLFVRQRQFKGYDLSLETRIADPAVRQALQAQLAGIPAIRQDGSPAELILLQSAPKRPLVLMTPDNVILYSAKVSSEKPDPDLKGLMEAIGNYAQAQFLRRLEFDGSPYHMDISVQVKHATNLPEVYQTPPIRVNKDTVVITFRNNSQSKLYFTVLDIDSQNKVGVLMPGKGWSPSDFVIGPGESMPRSVRFNTMGTEVLKVIATPVPIELREALANRGRDFRDRSFFETLFANTFLERSGGRGPEDWYKGSEAGVSTVVLEVVK